MKTWYRRGIVNWVSNEAILRYRVPTPRTATNLKHLAARFVLSNSPQFSFILVLFLVLVLVLLFLFLVLIRVVLCKTPLATDTIKQQASRLSNVPSMALGSGSGGQIATIAALACASALSNVRTLVEQVQLAARGAPSATLKLTK